MTQFSPAAIAAAADHAREAYPEESCGLIVNGEYIRATNIAEDPKEDFEIPAALYKKHLLTGKIEAIVHSHPDGPLHPSEADMASQMATNLTWVILGVDADKRVSDPIVWGGKAPIPNVIGREFVHGVTDCYSLIRDTFRLGKTKLAEQGIEDWPFDPITLPDFARMDSWWAKSDANFYDVEPIKLGFIEVPMHEARAGDLFFMLLGKTSVNNHAGIYLGNNLILHHLPSRLSRRELAGGWGRQATKWMRYVGAADAA